MASLDCLEMVERLSSAMVDWWSAEVVVEIVLKGLFIPVVLGPATRVLGGASRCRLCVKVVSDESVLLMASWGLMELGVLREGFVFRTVSVGLRKSETIMSCPGKECLVLKGVTNIVSVLVILSRLVHLTVLNSASSVNNTCRSSSRSIGSRCS